MSEPSERVGRDVSAYLYMADLIATKGKSLDYEQMALDAVERSWHLEERECQALALVDAQVWATLHLADVTRRAEKPVATGSLDEAKNLLERWIGAWKHGAQHGESTSTLARQSADFIERSRRNPRG